jgi:GNAT superfamily N-acetyltransferase
VGLRFATLNEDPELAVRQREIVASVWKPFMLQDALADRCWARLERYFADFQIYLLRGDELLGLANTIPFCWHLPLKWLPQRGWDWLMERGITGHERGTPPNCLGGLQLAVAAAFQGQGYSAMLLEEMKREAIRRGLSRLLVPIRPTLKHHYPLLPMGRYLGWDNGRGLPYDPWIRTHVKSGARIVRTCRRSMTIRGSVEQWEGWTGLAFRSAGRYPVGGATSAVRIDLATDEGLHHDRNVWVCYDLRRRRSSPA